MKKIKQFFNTIIFKIRLAVEDEHSRLYKDVEELAVRYGQDFKKMVRNEYILIAKMAQRAQSDYERAEALMKEGKEKGVSIIDDLESKVAETEAVVKSYSKKMFAHLGMFEAYGIEKVKQEEISILRRV